MTTLVIGGTGRCGRPLVFRLLRLGQRVRVLSRSASHAKAKLIASKGAEIVEGNLRIRTPEMDSMLEGVDRICLITSPEDGFEEEVVAGAHLIEMLKGHDLMHLVFQSVSLAETTIPHCASKRKVEILLEESDLPYTILRPAVFMEILDSTLEAWYESNDPWLYLGHALDPKVACSWIAVEDIAKITTRILMYGSPHRKTYDLAAPIPMALEDISRVLRSISGGRLLEFEQELLSFATGVRLRLGDQRARVYLRDCLDINADYYGPINQGDGIADPEPIMRDFGVRFTSLEEYIRRGMARLARKAGRKLGSN